MDGLTYLDRVMAADTFAVREAVAAEAREKENKDRTLYSMQRDSWEVPELAEPYKPLVEVFDGESGSTRVHYGTAFPEEAALPLMFAKAREKAREAPMTVPSLAAFRENFNHAFGYNLLQFLNWDNVVAAGGAVAGCVRPVPAQHESLLEKRNYYQDDLLGSSDVDLFLYAMTEAEANRKLVEIYEAVCQACPFEVICFRSAHAVTMVSQYPYRHVQVVLRLYSSPYEVLAGFDVDACTFAYDGKKVYTTCRGHYALLTGYNTIDLSRRSPSYEMRLAKYASRGFAVHVPGYDRDRIDPNIFDKPWGLLHGLAKLIVLEQLQTPQKRYQYMNRQRAKKQANYTRYLSARQIERMEKSGGSAELSNYSTVFLPWGPEHTARRIMKLMKKKDISVNGKWFAKDRTYRLHPCFYGTAEEVLTDMAPDDPPIPEDVPEEKLRPYVRGVMTWLQDDPGRQQIGSFNPITTDDWADGAYCLPETVELFRAVNRNDAEAVVAGLGADGQLFVRDFLGRSPLHLAVMAGAADVVNVILEKKLTDPALRLPDGRNALHLCAQYNQPGIARCIIAAVKTASEEAVDQEGARKIVFSDVVEQEDNSNNALRPLHYATLLRHEAVAETLLRDAGAQAAAPVRKSGRESAPWATPLLLIPEPETDEEAASVSTIVACLCQHGAATQAGLLLDGFDTIFHHLAEHGKAGVLAAVIAAMEKKSGALLKKMLNVMNFNAELPICRALEQGHLECAKLLYSHTKVLAPTQKTCDAARLMAAKYDLNGVDYQIRRGINTLRAVEPADECAPLTTVLHQLVAVVSEMTSREQTEMQKATQQLLLGVDAAPVTQDDRKELVKRLLETLRWLREVEMDVGMDVTADDVGICVDAEVTRHHFGRMRRAGFGHQGRKSRKKGNFGFGAAPAKDAEKKPITEWLRLRCETLDKQAVKEAGLSEASPAVTAFEASLSAGYEALVGREALRTKHEQYFMPQLQPLREAFLRLRESLGDLADSAKADAFAAFLDGVDQWEAPPSPFSAAEMASAAPLLQSLQKQLFGSFTITGGKQASAWQGSAATSAPEATQGTLLRAFKAAYTGDTAALDAALAEEAAVPLASTVDVFTNTLFVTSMMAPRSDVAGILARLLARAQKEYEPHKPLVFDEGPAPTRFDNFKLLEEMMEKLDVGSDGNSDDDEEDEEEDEDDEDVTHAKKMHRMTDAMGGSSSASQHSPAALLQLAGYVPTALIRPLLPPEWSAEMDALAKKTPVPETYHLTPLELAVLQDRADVAAMLLKFLRRYPAKGGQSPAHEALDSSNALRLAVALERLDIVKVFVAHAAGGADWQAMATAMGVGTVFKASEGSQRSSKRYQGVSSRLEKKAKRDEAGDTNSACMPGFTHSTIAEMASFYGATTVLDWALSGAPAALYAEFLADEPSGVLQKALTAFVGRVQENITRLPWVAEAVSGLASAAPNEALALLAVNHLPEVGAWTTRGDTLMQLAIQGHAVASVEYLLARDPALAKAPCSRGLFLPLMVRMCTSPWSVKGWVVAREGTPHAEKANRHSPCVVAVKEGAVGPLRALLAHGGDILARDCVTHDSLLQLALAESRTHGEALCAAMAEVGGTAAMKELMKAENAQGINGLMFLCGNAQRAEVRCMAAICAEVLPEEVVRAACGAGRTVLHKAAKAHADAMLRALRVWVDSPLAAQEDFTGFTPVDYAVMKKSLSLEDTALKAAPHFKAQLAADCRQERRLASHHDVRDFVFARLVREDHDPIRGGFYRTSGGTLERVRPLVLKAADCNKVGQLIIKFPTDEEGK
eukprot:TRINITY_DN4571_c0_g1_i1.p1 TRINITY_DN4571_c0_g1~~TRINITY_DN4571_c0_g1_i1.p1  ORF type:complete len:1795 (+),score=613.03 TRINITY_DN4571_c0_g1_i1:74-5458(+)